MNAYSPPNNNSPTTKAPTNSISDITIPTASPTSTPTFFDPNLVVPTSAATTNPTFFETNLVLPSALPTTIAPTNAPTNVPTTNAPTNAPTNASTNAPTNVATNAPTNARVTMMPTPTAPFPFPPTNAPTNAPTYAPTNEPTNPPTNQPTNAQTNVLSFELQPFDVLCGRNKSSYNNIGNRRFRILINLNLPHYLECQSRNERSEMILALTRDLCCCSESQTDNKVPSPNSCVRFFKRQKGVNELIELDFKGCREKIGHALRDAASQHNNNNNSNKSKEAIYETSTKQQQQQQKEEEAIVALTNLNSNYSENFFPNFDNNNGNNNETNNNGIHRDRITSAGAPRNWSRYSMEILHSLREEAVPTISSLFFNNTIDYNHCKDDSGNHQQQFNNFTGDGANSVMSDIEPLAI
mmetsp:Transcript_28996/g.33340  ORF Transcript_28996/g.33340 Transcript_28996/m.33340 type:complete len:410 (-) Transcript_28996:52-1281(-)